MGGQPGGQGKHLPLYAAHLARGYLFLIAGIIRGMRMIMESIKTQAAPPNLSTLEYCAESVATMKNPAARSDIPV